jgi:hypothetical protein
MAIPFNKAFATFWDVQEKKEKFARVKITTGDKQQDGTYINTNWIATFVGKAFEKIEELEIKDKIQITGKISNPYNKEKKQAYLNCLVWDFDFSSDIVRNNPIDSENLQPVDDNELPF